MTDTEFKKGLLRSAREDLRFLAHFFLIPPVAACKGLAALFAHLATELAKV